MGEATRKLPFFGEHTTIHMQSSVVPLLPCVVPLLPFGVPLRPCAVPLLPCVHDIIRMPSSMVFVAFRVWAGPFLRSMEGGGYNVPPRGESVVALLYVFSFGRTSAQRTRSTKKTGFRTRSHPTLGHHYIV